MTGRRFGALAVALLWAGLAWGTPAVVQTREGQTYDGDVVDHPADDFITVTVRGIPTRIQRAEVVSVNTSGMDKEYQERLAKLDPKDAKGRLALARWAFDERRYDLARDATNKALEIQPNSAEATQFLDLILYQQRLERQKAASRPAREDGAAADGRPAVRDATTGPERDYLNARGINRIRQEEMRRIDDRARVVFKNDVEKRFVDSSRKYTLLGFRQLSPAQRAMRILDEGDPSLRDDVHVMTDPMAIQEFRRLVQPLVTQNCGTSGCHGGANAGEFVIFPNAENSEAATYSNFYILQTYATKLPETQGAPGGVFGNGGVRKMIDRLDPESSLLLQYGLPRNQTKTPHPPVPDFRPVYKGREYPKYQAIHRWIMNTLRPGESKYDIDDWSPPHGNLPHGEHAATAPATQPVRNR